MELLIAILFGYFIYLIINEKKKKYLCFCLVGVILFCLLTRSKEIEGFDNANFPNSGIMIDSNGITKLSDSSALTVTEVNDDDLGDEIQIQDEGISLSSGDDYRYADETLDFSGDFSSLFNVNNILGNSQIKYLIIRSTVDASNTQFYIYKVNLSCPEMSPRPSMSPCPVLSPVSPSPSPSTPLWEYVLIALFVLVPFLGVVGMIIKNKWLGPEGGGKTSI